MKTARVWFEDLADLCQGLERLCREPVPSAERAAVPEQVREPVAVMTVEERTQLPA
jgi:hypothetical protein